jgi:hypothetical protein
MANPLFVAGMKSPNPAGRPKQSVRTVAGMLQAFITRNVTPQALKKLFGLLSPKEQAEFLLACFPYIMPKKQAEGLTAADIDEAYDKLMNAIKSQSNGAKAS